MDVSPQVKAIEKNANIIAMLISGNLTLIANDLRELLDDLDYSRIVNTTATPPLERANDLIQCVITHIKVDPAKYEIFYSVMKKYRTLQALLKKLPEPDAVITAASYRFKPSSVPCQSAGPVSPRRMGTDSEVNPELCERPNLVSLISFPGNSDDKINIPQQISTKYYKFGVLLLNDETGAEVDTITTQYRGDAERINLEILKQWIGGKGKPLNWDILIGVLKDIGLGNLSSEIKDKVYY